MRCSGSYQERLLTAAGRVASVLGLCFGWALALFTLQVGAATPPEYIAAELPSSATLEEARSATSTVGIVPETRLPKIYLPSKVLPWLRKQIGKSGIPFFDESVFTVAPRYYYRYSDNRDGSISEALAIGGYMGLETGWLYDFLRLGLTGYTSLRLYGPKDRGGSGLLKPVQESYALLGQAYLDMNYGHTYLSVGRLDVDVPYINGNDSRMTPNSFEALALYFRGLKPVRFGLGHVNRIRLRTNSSFQSMSEAAGAQNSDEGVSVAGMRWDISEDFNVSLVEMYGWDTFNTVYLESDRTFTLRKELTLELGAQFTDQRGVGDALVGDFTAQLLGLKASLGLGSSLVATTSVTWNFGGSDIRKPWGGSPSYNSVMISDFDRAGERSLRFAMSYDLADVNLKGWSAASYFVVGRASGASDEQEFGVTVDYRVPEGTFDNLWLRCRAAWNDRSDSATVADYRVILNYSFTF